MELGLAKFVTVGIYHSRIAVKNRAVTNPRRTAMFEIEIPLEDGGISYIDNTEMPIRRDTIICAKPGQLRHTRLPFRCYYIHIILPQGDLLHLLQQMPDFIRTDKTLLYTELFQKMLRCYESGLAEDEVRLHGLILELVYRLMRDSEKMRTQERVKNSGYKGTETVIESILQYIGENLSTDLTLETVAARAGFSPIYFHNLFRTSTGRTLRDYVEEKRLKKAANMLLTTDKTLIQIAYECGFSSQSYFSYAFKRKTGMTPREYTKKVFERYEEDGK